MNIYDIFILKIQNWEQPKCSFSHCIKNVLNVLKCDPRKKQILVCKQNTDESQNHLA